MVLKRFCATPCVFAVLKASDAMVLRQSTDDSDGSGDGDDSGLPVAAIIGIAVGGGVVLLTLLLCLCVCVFCWRRSHRKKAYHLPLVENGREGTDNGQAHHGVLTTSKEVPVIKEERSKLDLTQSPDQDNPLYMYSFDASSGPLRRAQHLEKERESDLTVTVASISQSPRERSLSYVQMLSAGSAHTSLVVQGSVPHSKSMGDLAESEVYSEIERKAASFIALETTSADTPPRPMAFSNPVDKQISKKKPVTPPPSPSHHLPDDDVPLEEYVETHVFREDFVKQMETYVNKNTIEQHHSFSRLHSDDYEATPTTDAPNKVKDFQTVSEFLGDDSDSYYNVRDVRGSSKEAEGYENITGAEQYLQDDYENVREYQGLGGLPRLDSVGSGGLPRLNSVDNEYIYMTNQRGDGKERCVSEPVEERRKYENLDYSKEDAPLYENTAEKSRSATAPTMAVQPRSPKRGDKARVMEVLEFPPAPPKDVARTSPGRGFPNKGKSPNTSPRHEFHKGKSPNTSPGVSRREFHKGKSPQTSPGVSRREFPNKGSSPRLSPAREIHKKAELPKPSPGRDKAELPKPSPGRDKAELPKPSPGRDKAELPKPSPGRDKAELPKPSPGRDKAASPKPSPEGPVVSRQETDQTENGEVYYMNVARTIVPEVEELYENVNQ